jgi:hypothetical protein
MDQPEEYSSAVHFSHCLLRKTRHYRSSGEEAGICYPVLVKLYSEAKGEDDFA